MVDFEQVKFTGYINDFEYVLNLNSSFLVAHRCSVITVDFEEVFTTWYLPFLSRFLFKFDEKRQFNNVVCHFTTS